jgi:hypothetical protein
MKFGVLTGEGCTRYTNETSSKASPAATRKRCDVSIRLGDLWKRRNRCG